MFDITIIGAGISGSTLAYFFSKNGLKVAIVDKESIAAGGSGAAGAFISPKISKGGELKALHVEAFRYALKFYNEFTPTHITNIPQLHIAKEKDAEKLKSFKKECEYEIEPRTPLHVEQLLRPDAKDSASIYFKNSAIVDAKGVCEQLCKDATFFKKEIKELNFIDGVYDFGGFRSKSVVLTTGAYSKIVDEPYLKYRGIWGHRINVKTSTKIPLIIHHHLSISPTSKDDTVALGATHDVHYRLNDPYDISKGREELLQKASATIELKDVEVLEDFTGLRSGSNDYLPHVGRVVDSKKSLKKFPNLKNGLRVKNSELIYYENLYILNGLGGYGFVLAPYLAQLLVNSVSCGVFNEEYEVSRFFKKYVKAKR